MGNLAAHIGSALTYLIVVACAVALAVTSSHGPARAVRCAVVVAVLAAPLLAGLPILALLEEPDHIGTSLFLLVTFLLIDRVPDRRFTAPLVCLILCAGELSDLTVRYVAVPAVVLVCGYRVLAARKLRCGDTALVGAAVVSVPLEWVLRAAMVHFDAEAAARLLDHGRQAYAAARRVETTGEVGGIEIVRGRWLTHTGRFPCVTSVV